MQGRSYIADLCVCHEPTPSRRRVVGSFSVPRADQLRSTFTSRREVRGGLFGGPSSLVLLYAIADFRPLTATSAPTRRRFHTAPAGDEQGVLLRDLRQAVQERDRDEQPLQLVRPPPREGEEKMKRVSFVFACVFPPLAGRNGPEAKRPLRRSRIPVSFGC